MVYIVLNDRLGNNLFQIAAGASLAKENNSDFVAVCQDGYSLASNDKRSVSQYIEQFKTNIFRKILFEVSRPGDYYHYNEPKYSYSKIPYKDNIRVKGWFQSEKYFDRELVLDLYEISPQIKEYIHEKYGKLLIPENHVVSVNVRRGDYLKLPHLHPTCSLSYYKKAMDMMGKDKKFLIMSDDIEWCKRSFIGDNFFFSDNESPIVDLYLATFCESNIISNSTFGWWGAWLNPNPDKKVICPSKWFGIGYKDKDESDLIPESWMQIKSEMDLKLKLLAYYLYSKNEFIDAIRKITPSFLRQTLKKLKN